MGESISHYRFEERIGAGGMGEVFKAFDTKLERPVAIKRLHTNLSSDPAYRRRFLREAQHAAQITHQGVAGIHDVLEKGGELFLVMEYVEGHTLSRAGLHRSDISTLLKIAIKCAEALVAAHEIGLIHRDIKPANIMLTQAGEIKILDFGLAKVPDRTLSSEDTTTSNTKEGEIRGTLAYMSPEVLLGRTADHRSDLFSLGVVFYQLLTDKYPFEANTSPNTINNILNSNPLPVVRFNSTVPIELEECVFRLLEKNPELRYASAQDLLAHLRKIERDVSFTSRPLTPVSQRGLWLRRHHYSLGLLSLVVLGVPAFLIIKSLIPPSLPPNPVIAVIPFEVISGDETSIAFRDGLSEMVAQRLGALSLKRPFTAIPASIIRRHPKLTPQETEKEGANLVLTGTQEVRDGNVNVVLKLLSAGNTRELRRGKTRAPLSRPADLEYAILEKALFFLEVGRDPPDRPMMPIIKSYPSSQAAYDYFLRGLGYYLEDRVAESVDSFQKSLQLEPGFALAKAYLGLAFLRDKASREEIRLPNAQRLCQEARALDLQTQAADFCLGEVALATNSLQNARDYYESAIQKGLVDYDLLSGLLNVLERLGQRASMIPLLETVIERKPQFWLGYNFLAYVHSVEGNLELAVIQQKKAIALAPKRPSGYTNLAVFYDLLGCPEQTATTHQAALALNRNSTNYTNLAVTWFYAGQYVDALQAAQEAKVCLDWEETLSYIESGNLGDIYFWAPGGNRDTAAAFYSEALDLVNQFLLANPDDVKALRSRCWYLAMLEKENSAHQCLESLLGAPDLDYDTCYKVALVYQRLGREEEALDYLKRSLEEGKPSAPIHHEPIFRENQAVQTLLFQYSDEQKPCP